MIASNNDGEAERTLPLADARGRGETEAEAPAKGDFDTFETVFFQAGEEGGNLPGALEQFDDSGGGARGRAPLLSRPSMLGLTIVSACVALLACRALWRSNAPLPSLPAAAPPPSRWATAAATERPPSAAPAPAAVVPAAVPAAAPPASDARERCKQSIRNRRSKEILASCPAAFAEDAGDADVAVAIAKVELDRGRFAQAHAWSEKAIAINPAAADAYVIAGGAEQSRGHGKAAKQAYLHYLRLAPSGRYAAELRAIVRSL